jgi:hypothetical protein
MCVTAIFVAASGLLAAVFRREQEALNETGRLTGALRANAIEETRAQPQASAKFRSAKKRIFDLSSELSDRP